MHAGAEQRALNGIKLAHAAAERRLAGRCQRFFLQIEQQMGNLADALEQRVQCLHGLWRRRRGRCPLVQLFEHAVHHRHCRVVKFAGDDAQGNIQSLARVAFLQQPATEVGHGDQMTGNAQLLFLFPARIAAAIQPFVMLQNGQRNRLQPLKWWLPTPYLSLSEALRRVC